MIRMMRKTGIAACIAAALAFCTLPAGAQTLTDINPSGDTTVTADVANGDVTYIISIPDKIDFGRLTPPENDSAPHPKEESYTVEAMEINGLQKGTSRVVVLMKDAVANSGFQITGRDTANMGKTLSYSVFVRVDDLDEDISTNTRYANGYLLTGFDKADESVTGTLKLDQNQLYGVDLSSWAGNYQGTIRFFSRVASLDDYN